MLDSGQWPVGERQEKKTAKLFQTNFSYFFILSSSLGSLCGLICQEQPGPVTDSKTCSMLMHFDELKVIQLYSNSAEGK